MSEKICKDCKHHIYDIHGKWKKNQHLCYARKVEEKTDIVTGEKYKTTSFLGYCHDVRDSEELCGLEGKLFEKREKSIFEKYNA